MEFFLDEGKGEEHSRFSISTSGWIPRCINGFVNPAPDPIGFFPVIFLCGNRNSGIEVFESADQRFLCSSD